ncbi:hypothetical protein AB0M58_13840 [Streptomyces bobili]|uniref:hypothetical protein n=1 Tax=Streptomyces bobili TaxID=67280 RepID=UPI00343FAB5F
MTPGSHDLGQAPDDTAAPTREERVEALADELAGQYDFAHLAELETSDPERAREHRIAAHGLAKWLDAGPRRERKAAFCRGWDRAKARAQRRITELEDLIASLRPQPAPAESQTAGIWRQVRDDPRYALVRREAVRLDHYDGTMVIPYSLQELLAVRVMAAILDAESGQQVPAANGEPGAD